MSSRLREHILAAAILGLAMVVFFWRPLFKGEVFVTAGLIKSDLMGYAYPSRDFYGRSLREGALPLWTKDISAGFPIAAEGQLGVFYPFNLLFFSALPLPGAFNFTIAFHLFLAALFTYLLVRIGYHRSFGAGVLSGLCFGLSGFFVSHVSHPNMIQVAAFFPLTLLFLERQFKRASWGNICGLTIVSLFQVLAGHLQVLYYFQVVIGIYLLARAVFSYHKKGLSAFAPLGSLVLSLMLAALFSLSQTLPSWEFIRNSEREGGISFLQATSYRFPLSHFARFVVPDGADFSEPVRYGEEWATINFWETYGYLGLLPLILAVGTLFAKGDSEGRGEGGEG